MFKEVRILAIWPTVATIVSASVVVMCIGCRPPAPPPSQSPASNGRPIDTSDDALHEYLRDGEIDTLIRALEVGGDVNAANYRGDPLLMVAAATGETDAAMYLLGRPDIDVNAAGKAGLTALHAAARVGNLRLVRALMAAGADVHSLTNSNDSVLLMAAANGDPEIVSLLLERGVDTDIRGYAGRTALHRAAIGNRAAAAEALLASGADPTILDDDGRTPAEWAEEEGYADLADLLREAEAEWEAPAED